MKGRTTQVDWLAHPVSFKKSFFAPLASSRRTNAATLTSSSAPHVEDVAGAAAAPCSSEDNGPSPSKSWSSLLCSPSSSQAPRRHRPLLSTPPSLDSSPPWTLPAVLPDCERRNLSCSRSSLAAAAATTVAELSACSSAGAFKVTHHDRWENETINFHHRRGQILESHYRQISYAKYCTETLSERFQ